MENETAGTATSSTHTTAGCGFISSCKYRLPCGICDRTGNHCTEFFNYPYYPYYPSWYHQGTCTIDSGSIKSGTITASTKEDL